MNESKTNVITTPPEGTVGVVWVWGFEEKRRGGLFPYEYVGSKKIPAELYRITKPSNKHLTALIAVSAAGKCIGIATPRHFDNESAIEWKDTKTFDAEWFYDGQDLDAAIAKAK